MKGRSPLSRQSPFVIALIYSMKVRHMLALVGNPWCRIIYSLHEQAKIILMALETGFLLLTLVCVVYLGLYFFWIFIQKGTGSNFYEVLAFSHVDFSP